MRAERSDSGRAAGREYPSPRAGGPTRARTDGRDERQRPPRPERNDSQRYDSQKYDSQRYDRPSARSGHPADPRVRDPRMPDPRMPDPRAAGRGGARPSAEVRRPAGSAERRTGSVAAGLSRTAPVSGPRLHGALAVLGVFLLTLVAAAADSYIGVGLGTITLVALTVGTVLATLAVRRRDLVSVLVAPPLVFVAVALVNIGLAPSASLNLPTLATLLVRGFPAMAIATAAAVLVALFRLVTRR